MKCQPLERPARVATVVILLRNLGTTTVCLAFDVGLTDLALGVERVDLHLEIDRTALARWPSCDPGYGARSWFESAHRRLRFRPRRPHDSNHLLCWIWFARRCASRVEADRGRVLLGAPVSDPSHWSFLGADQRTINWLATVVWSRMPGDTGHRIVEPGGRSDPGSKSIKSPTHRTLTKKVLAPCRHLPRTANQALLPRSQRRGANTPPRFRHSRVEQGGSNFVLIGAGRKTVVGAKHVHQSSGVRRR